MGSTRARDDETHSLLSKAREVSQTKLETFLDARLDERDRPSLPRSSFGPYEVKQLEVESALTDCQLPGRSWSLNPYTGCSHDCAYCYVPDVAHLHCRTVSA
jgi:tRNA A37 methylthiotransferase MiaB